MNTELLARAIQCAHNPRLDPPRGYPLCVLVEQLHAQCGLILKAEHELSDAYIRIRQKLNAFDTPYAPTGEQVWAHTEQKLDELVAERDALLLLLEPFAKLLQSHNDKGDGSTPVFGINDARITVSDLRKARAAIDKARAK